MMGEEAAYMGILMLVTAPKSTGLQDRRPLLLLGTSVP